jgi:hypothetical protein
MQFRATSKEGELDKLRLFTPNMLTTILYSESGQLCTHAMGACFLLVLQHVLFAAFPMAGNVYSFDDGSDRPQHVELDNTTLWDQATHVVSAS